MSHFLVDTNVISELSRPRPDPGVVKFMADQAEPYISVITYHELIFGIFAMKPSRRQEALKESIDNFFTIIHFAGRFLPVDEPVARTAAVMRATAARTGHTATFADSLIAATAYAKNLTVVTRNVADFEPLNVAVFNPWTKQS